MPNAYAKSDLRAILIACNIKIESQTGSDFLCLCPFHHNTSSPAFAVSYSKGLYICYNESCGASGNILDLVIKLTNKNHFEALRFINVHKLTDAEVFEEELQEILSDKPEFIEFPQITIDTLHNNLMTLERGREYFHSRGIFEDAMKHFHLGYSVNQDMVTVPLLSPTGMPVGMIGRSIEGKVFKNSPNLPRNKTMFNLSEARKFGGSIIVVESSFDAIRLWQAGYPNAVAVLGSSLSKENLHYLNKYSTKITIMTDNDLAGRALGKTIVSKLNYKDIYWAYYGEGKVYPHLAKDVGDLKDSEIQHCIDNAISNFEYQTV